MKYLFKAFIVLFTLSTAAFGAENFVPNEDLTYLGAFKIPNTGKTSQSCDGFDFYPNGDVNNNDNFPGSIYTTGHRKGVNGGVAEFGIPEPVKSKSLDRLPAATILQDWHDVTGGICNESLTGRWIGDVEYLEAKGNMKEDKLLWMTYEKYMPDNDMYVLGWSSTDVSNPDSQKIWRADAPAAAYSSYLTQIPKDWAEQYTQNRTVAMMRKRNQAGGSFGPAIYTVAPWNYGTPPPDGAVFDVTKLMHFPESNEMCKFYNRDTYKDTVWIEAGNKASLVMPVKKSIRHKSSIGTYYGPPGVYGCGNKGPHGEPYKADLTFFDVDGFADVLTGTKAANEICPYARFNITEYTVNLPYSCHGSQIGGIAYDKRNNYLYVGETNVSVSEYEKTTVIHVFKVQDIGSSLDTTKPTTPNDLKLNSQNSSAIELSWNDTEEQSDTYYIVWQKVYTQTATNGTPRIWSPIKATNKTTYTDTKFTAFNASSIEYKVEARDRLNNRSEFSSVISILDTLTPPNNLELR